MSNSQPTEQLTDTPPYQVAMMHLNHVSLNLKRFIMVSVHIPDEEIENRHVHEIEEFSPFVVGWRHSNARAISGVRFPRRLPVFVVTPAPGMAPHLSVRGRRRRNQLLL